MNSKAKHAISPLRSEDYPEWYQQVVKASDMAETCPSPGSYVIKPWGYAIWENIQKDLDRRFKETGHVNAYFPLLIPKSLLEKEATHVEGFAKECAVVTHHRLEEKNGTLVPAGPLEEPLVIRPTSETIIGEVYSKWVQSYRDLPILVNQWANVFRWEMRTRVFLRTREFLWQEGHTCHATAEEAIQETKTMLSVYQEFLEEVLALGLIPGEKPPHERFPGALNTYTVEAMMQDKKALQAGTSHFLGQSFSKAADIQFLDQNGVKQHCWTTSWGVSTRLIGGLVMTHSDDDGLVLPPRVAPLHAVILPIYRTPEEEKTVLETAHKLKAELSKGDFFGEKLKVSVDTRDLRGGEKIWYHIKRGVPLRIEVGPRDVASGSAMVARRDTNQKESVSFDALASTCLSFLHDMQKGLLTQSKSFLKANTHTFTSSKDLESFFTPKNQAKPEIHGGFARVHLDPNPVNVQKLKDLGVTVRCRVLEGQDEPGNCIYSGQKVPHSLIVAKSY